MAVPENANVQRHVNLTCTVRLLRPGNMANLNPGVLGVDINNFEDQLGQNMADFIIEVLNAQDDPVGVVEELYVMRVHSDVVVNVQRAIPDGNVFNVNATFTVKYNNDDFWDYDDRFMDRDVSLLTDALIEDFSSRVQNVNNVGFFPQVENVDMHMDDEMPFVPIQPVVAPAMPAEEVEFIPNAPPPANENNENQGQAMHGGRRTRSRRTRSRRTRSRRTRSRRTRSRRGRKN